MGHRGLRRGTCVHCAVSSGGVRRGPGERGETGSDAWPLINTAAFDCLHLISFRESGVQKVNLYS